MSNVQQIEVAGTPQALILQAIDKGLSIEHLEKLMGLQERWQAGQAKMAFLEAMSKFQAECPIIEKRKKVFEKGSTTKVRYSYAPLDSIVEQTKDLIAKHNLAYTIKTTNNDKEIIATCRVTHIGGHSEESSFVVPIGTEQYMSDVQKYGARATFAKRYAFCDAFGIMTGDEDSDATPQSLKNNDHAEPEETFAPTQSEVIKDISFKTFDPKTECITFGMYGPQQRGGKGLEWIALDRGYLGWILENGQPAAKQKAKATLEYVDNLKVQAEVAGDPMDAAFGKKEEIKPAVQSEKFQKKETIAAPPIDVLLSSLDEVALKNNNEELTKWWTKNHGEIEKLNKQEKSIVTKAFNHAKVKEK